MLIHSIRNLKKCYIKEDLNSDYTKNYSDIPSDDFDKIIRLDADSYPNQDITKEPFKVGQLAGGNGLLIKTYRKGNNSWLQDSEKCDKILQATAIFYKNRRNMPIKNPSQFESIDQFIDMVLNGADVKAVEKPKESEEDKALNKIENLRLSQFPSIPSDKFLKLIEIDDESDIKKGVVSATVKTFLAPFYIKMTKSNDVDLENEENFLFNNRLKVRKLIYTLDSLSEQERKEIISSTDSVQKLYNSVVYTFITGDSYYLKNLRNVCIEGSDYEYLTSTDEYDLVISKSQEACNLADRAQLLYDSSIDFKEWVRNTDNNNRLCINSWCTGWHNQNDGYNDFFNRYKGIYINIIWKKYKENINGWSHQIAILQNGEINEVCQGGSYREEGYLYPWRSCEEKIRNGKITDVDSLLTDAESRSTYFADLIRIFKNNRKFITKLKNSSIADRLYKNTLFNLLFKIEDSLSNSYSTEYEVNEFETYTYNLETINEAKLNRNLVLELIIPEGVTSIPQGTFEKWINLISIKFPSSLKVIGPRAFANCLSLKKLNLNEGLETIGMGAFSGCSNLSGSIALPFSIQKIEPFAFEGHNKKGLSFTLPAAFFNPELNKKLYVPVEPEEEKNWWFQKGRFKERM